MGKFWKELRQEWNREAKWLAVIIGLVILLRLPSLFEPYWYGDEGVALTIGNALSKGLVLYRDIHDNKPPFWYLLAMAAGSQTFFRAILTAWMTAGTLLFWKLVHRIFSRRFALLLTGAFGILTSIPLLEGNIVNGEILFLPLTIAGMLCTWQALAAKGKESPKWAFLAGISFALGSLFKVPAAFDGLAAGILLLYLTIEDPKRRRQLTAAVSLLAIGFALPWLGVALVEWLQGAWSGFLKEALLQNIGYLSTWTQPQSSATLSLSPASFSGRLILAAIFTTLLLAAKRYFSFPTFFASLWLIWTLFGATLSGRPYAHYFLQLVPPVIILVGRLSLREKLPDKLASLSGLILAAAVIFKWQPWFYHVLPYYGNFLGWTSGRVSQQDYLLYFDKSVPAIYELTGYLKKNTLPSDRVFIWGDLPQIYALSQRLPVGRYTTAYHVADFDPSRTETLQALRTTPPKYVIWLANEPRPFPELTVLLNRRYLKKEVVGQGIIYELRAPGF